MSVLRRIGLWLAGLEDVPPADAQAGLQGYLMPTKYAGTRTTSFSPGEQMCGRVRDEGAIEIRCIIEEKNEWLLMRRAAK